MPYILEGLDITRVDLVDEGANSAAFIELYKRKEQSKMELEEILSKLKPEHAGVIKSVINKSQEELATVISERDTATQELSKAKEDLSAANDDLAKANSELEALKAADATCKACGNKKPADKGCGSKKTTCKECGAEFNDDDDKCPKCGKARSGAAFDETETMKGMPEAAKELFAKMKAQKEAAEEELRKAKDAECTAKAVAKAAELKAIPYAQDKLVDVIKSASPEMLDLLTVVNAAIEGTVLDEVGKSNTGSTSPDAWSKIESKAEEIAKRDSVTKAKAISIAITEHPELYKEYLQGGAN